MRVRARLATSSTDDRELQRQVLERLRWLSFGAIERAAQAILRSESYREVTVVGNRHWRGRSHSGGVDIKAWLPTETGRLVTLVQVKDPKVGLTVQRRFVDELRGVMLRFSAGEGLIFSTDQFSRPALHVALIYPRLPVRLIDGARFAKLMIKHGLGVRVKPLPLNQLPEVVVDELFFERLEELRHR